MNKIVGKFVQTGGRFLILSTIAKAAGLTPLERHRLFATKQSVMESLLTAIQQSPKVNGCTKSEWLAATAAAVEVKGTVLRKALHSSNLEEALAVIRDEIRPHNFPSEILIQALLEEYFRSKNEAPVRYDKQEITVYDN